MGAVDVIYTRDRKRRTDDGVVRFSRDSSGKGYADQREIHNRAVDVALGKSRRRRKDHIFPDNSRQCDTGIVRQDAVPGAVHIFRGRTGNGYVRDIGGVVDRRIA